MARLLRAQQIARAPNLQVPHGNLKAGAELREIPDGAQPLFRHLRQGFIRPVGEVGEGMAAGAAHSAPELVKLAQTQPVGVFDNQGVYVGNVQTGLDDGGTHQHLDLSVGHGLHHIAEGVLAHFSVGHGDGDVRHSFVHGGGAPLDGLHPVVQIVDLSAPLHLPADGVVQNGGFMLHDEGLNGVAVGGGLLDGGHIPDAGQGHVEGPGDGGGRQGQHIHALGNFLQTLLVGDAEALLLVHHQQAQVLELDGLLQQLVGADDDVHGAGPQIL